MINPNVFHQDTPSSYLPFGASVRKAGILIVRIHLVFQTHDTQNTKHNVRSNTFVQGHGWSNRMLRRSGKENSIVRCRVCVVRGQNITLFYVAEET